MEVESVWFGCAKAGDTTECLLSFMALPSGETCQWAPRHPEEQPPWTQSSGRAEDGRAEGREPSTRGRGHPARSGGVPAQLGRCSVTSTGSAPCVGRRVRAESGFASTSVGRGGLCRVPRAPGIARSV